LAAALRAAAAFADGRRQLLRIWRRVARRHGASVSRVPRAWLLMSGSVDGRGLSVTTNEQPPWMTMVQVAPAYAGLRPFVLSRDEHARAEAAVGGAAIPAGFHLWTSHASATERLLERVALPARAPNLQQVTASSEGVEVTLLGICRDQRELQAALALALGIAGDRAAPYR
jgi:hypothetical protein